MTLLSLGETDASRCRFAVSPLWETQSAARLPRDRSNGRLGAVAPPEWKFHKLALDALPAVQPVTGYTPAFLTPPPRVPLPALRAEIATVRTTPLERVTAELARTRGAPVNPQAEMLDRMIEDPAAARNRLADEMTRVWTLLVRPIWPRLRRILEDDIAYRGRQVTNGGLDLLFRDLHPSIRWDGRALDARRCRDRDRELAGAGLLLIPSVFAGPNPFVLVEPAYQPTLIYPARGSARLWADSPRGSNALARLIGRTRATVLAQLDAPSTTSGLADELGLALATVADHLGALHDAGLCSRRQSGRQVHYSLTELGRALLATTSGGDAAGQWVNRSEDWS